MLNRGSSAAAPQKDILAGGVTGFAHHRRHLAARADHRSARSPLTTAVEMDRETALLILQSPPTRQTSTSRRRPASAAGNRRALAGGALRLLGESASAPGSLAAWRAEMAQPRQ